jgi:hypothetical protein
LNFHPFAITVLEKLQLEVTLSFCLESPI